MGWDGGFVCGVVDMILLLVLDCIWCSFSCFCAINDVRLQSFTKIHSNERFDNRQDAASAPVSAG